MTQMAYSKEFKECLKQAKRIFRDSYDAAFRIRKSPIGCWYAVSVRKTEPVPEGAVRYMFLEGRWREA